MKLSREYIFLRVREKTFSLIAGLVLESTRLYYFCKEILVAR